MKSLNLNKLWSMILLLSMTLGAVSCGNEEKETIPQLPDMAVIECDAGEECKIVFSAQNNWRLSSNKMWCKFKTSGGNFQDISGRAGTHEVAIVVGNEQIKDEVTEAEITIVMGSHKAIIARILRGPDKFYIKISDATDTSTNGVIKISYDAYTLVYVEANFDFKAVEWPEWVEIKDGSISGRAGEQVEALLRIVPNGDRERYAIKKEDGHVMVFSDDKGSEDRTFACPIIYDGMGRNIVITGPTNLLEWDVTADGKTFSQTNDEGETTTYQDKLEYNIVANKNIFHVIYVEKVIERGIHTMEAFNEEEANLWMHFDKYSRSLTVDPAAKPRYGYVLALPQEVYNFVLADLKTGIIFGADNSSGFDMPTIGAEYRQYIVASLTQSGSEVVVDTATQMHVYHSLTAYDIPALRYTDSAVMAQYGVEEAYIVPFVNSVPGKQPCIVINPRVEDWTTENLEAGRVGVEVWYKGELLKAEDKEYYVGENVDELLSLHLYGPKAGFEIGGENIYAVFKVDGEAKKLLVVTPPTK